MRAPLCALALAVIAPAQDLVLPLDHSDACWHGATVVADGVRGNAAHFDGDTAHIDVGPCAFVSTEPFTLRCSLRTRRGDFCTPWMARNGDAVGASLVLGRRRGCVSFEAWSWQQVKLISRVRIDDGAWHAIEVAYRPETTTALLFVDGTLQAAAALGAGGSPEATLRLGDNFGAHQPFAGDLDEVEVLRTAAHDDEFAWASAVLAPALADAALRDLRERLLPTSTPALREAVLADWPTRRAAVQRHVRDCLGLDPEPAATPLDVVVHGTLQQDDVVCERVSFRGFADRRATGWLWRPATPPTQPAPAILCPHGHWQDGAREPVVQARCASFARMGFVALAVDSTHAENVAAGASPIGAMTWHNRRALALLRARPDVDPQRLGVTGCSGGGQQTYYLMAAAADGELAAAAPICMACYFARIVADTSAHCRCNHLPRLASGTDVPEMCAVFAPRPAFFGSVTGDWTSQFPRAALPELQRLWRHLDAAAAVHSLHLDEGHGYSQPMREAVYGFFAAALTGGDGEPIAEQPFKPFANDRMLALGGPPQSALLDDAAAGRELLARRAKVASAAELAPGLPWRVTATPIAWTTNDGAATDWRRGSVRGDDGVPVPFVARGSEADASADWVVVVDGRGKVESMLTAATWQRDLPRLAVVDPRGIGEWQRYAAAWRRNGLLLGRGELYQAAHDTALVCASLPGSGRVQIVGRGDGAPIAVVAATLCSRVARVVADDLGPDYATAPNRTPLAPEILRFGGLAAFVAQLTGRCETVLGGDGDHPPLDDRALADAIPRPLAPIGR